MSQPNVPVQPYVVTEVKTITSFKMYVLQLELFTSITVRAELLNAEGGVVQLRYVVVDGDDYKNWSNDDRYLIDKVAEKMGLAPLLSESTPPTTEATPLPEDPTPSQPV